MSEFPNEIHGKTNQDGENNHVDMEEKTRDRPKWNVESRLHSRNEIRGEIRQSQDKGEEVKHLKNSVPEGSLQMKNFYQMMVVKDGNKDDEEHREAGQ